MEKRGYGSGRVLYWAHVGGAGERRESVRHAETAFELMPLVTERNPYEDVMLVDLATHPRLLVGTVLQDLLEPGVYLTEVARASLTAIDVAGIVRTISRNGETVWLVPDTTKAFRAYWIDDEPCDTGAEAMAFAHEWVRQLAAGHEDLPINLFPMSMKTAIALLTSHVATLGDLKMISAEELRAQTGADPAELAGMYRTIATLLQLRKVETAPNTDRSARITNVSHDMGAIIRHS